MSRPILNIVDERVVLTLTVQDNAVVLATEQAVLSAAARDDAETARLGAENAEDGAVAAAAAAEVAKIEWQGDWVAGTYQIHDAVAYLGSSWIANKTTAEVPSLIAVDWDLLAERGTDGDVLPVGAENDLLQANGLGVFEAKSTTLVNKSLTPFLNSPLGGRIKYVNLLAWDSFTRANENPITTLDSGQSYVNLIGTTGFKVVTNNGANAVTGGNSIGVAWGLGSVRLDGLIKLNSLSSIPSLQSSFIIMKDIDNFFEIAFGWQRLIINKTIAGVTTEIVNNTGVNKVNTGSLQRSFVHCVVNYFYRGNGGNSAIQYSIPEIGFSGMIGVTDENETFIANEDIAFVGLRSNTIIDTFPTLFGWSATRINDL